MSVMSEMETNSNQKVSCVANYAYDASEPDELTIRPGDMLRDVDRLPGGWWRGELRGRKGMFPDNFVSVLTEPGVPKASGAGVQGRCRAVFSYQPANPDELPLCVGDVLEVLGEVEEGWWQGRRQGRVGVFPSNFVVMLDPPQPAPPFEPAPALPPKPVKEQCRVLFAYTAVNEDELTLNEGEIVTIVSKEAPDRGWWRGELQGRVGLFPDNFVQMLPSVAEAVDEKKPERPPSKTNSIYPVLNKYSEKTASVKELTTSKISMHKENSLSKETSTQSTVTHTSKNESEKLIHSETVVDGAVIDGQIKKPPVPLKKSPTPNSGVGGLFSGLKSKMLSSSDKEKDKEKDKDKDKEKEKDKDKEKDKGALASSGSSSSGEWDRLDGAAPSKPPAAAAFDHVERNTLLSDPRAGRVKAPRRRPPSQALRDDTPQLLGLSNGHDAPPSEKPAPPPTEKSAAAEEIRPRAREWEKHRAPWMDELKLNQAKKTGFQETKSRSVSGPPDNKPAAAGSTDRILECGLEDERKRSTHSMEMSKSTSSISSRISVLESFEESKVRHSLDSTVKKEVSPAAREPEPAAKPALTSPTAAGRTLVSMLEEVKKPPAPSPPLASVRTSTEIPADKAPNTRTEKTVVTEKTDASRTIGGTFEKTETSRTIGAFEKTETSRTIGALEKTATLERLEKEEKEKDKSASNTLERRLHAAPKDKSEGNDALIAQLNNRISNLEKLIEVQNAMFKTAIEEISLKLKQESDKRQALQSEVEKLAHCVTQV